MIRVYDPTARKLVDTDTLPKKGWVHVVAPTDADLHVLQHDLALPPHLLEHATDPEELARLDRVSDETRLVVVRVPWHPGDGSDLPYRSSTLSIVVHGDLVVTIAIAGDEVVQLLLERDDLDPTRPHQFVLLLLLCTADGFLVNLRRIDHEVSIVEDQLQSSLANREVLQLLRYQKGLVHITTALTSDRILLERLQKDTTLNLSAEDHDLLEDVLVEFRQAAEMSAVSKDILSQMMDAFASIISNNLNVVMKFLASLTLIIAVPTLVATCYGMNVALPGATWPAAFYGLALFSALASLGLAWLFMRRSWL